MNSFTGSSGMNDVALKPKLLRSLLKDSVPDSKHAIPNPSVMSYVVSTVITHKLLSDKASSEQETADSWKEAVDSWFNRLLNLASSDLPDCCWAGVSLLGVTCQECNSERFLDSYLLWLNKLISILQLPAIPHFVKVAACAALSDLFTRLSTFQNVKKDGISQATRVVDAVLKILNEGSYDTGEALCLLCNLLNFFPSSVHQHYDSVEATVVSNMMSGKCSGSLLKKLSYSLSLLPKSRGDEDSWLRMMEKILILINSQLNDAFQGLEEVVRNNEAMMALYLSVKDSPTPLGGLAVQELTSNLSSRRPERLLGTRICALMSCCCTMLTGSYPAQVLVPIRGLLAIARRVLMVDGSSSYPFMTTLKREFICAELSRLQLHSLELLTAVINGLSSQALPYVADIVRMITQYLRKCTFPELRAQAYMILKVLLKSGGIGIAIYLGQDVINNIFVDLDLSGLKKADAGTLARSDVTTGPRRKRRKHSNANELFLELPADDCVVVEVPQTLISVTVKIAALEALEALLIVSGSSKSAIWRADVDYLLITVATNAFKGGWSNDEERNAFLSGEPRIVLADFQLAALRALLASLLSHGHSRPTHLALGLKLFRTGIQQRGSRLAEYCRHALLALEVLIHPRTLPLLDHSSNVDYKDPVYKFYDTSIHSSGQRQNSTIQNGYLGNDHCEPESDDDELNDIWLGSDGDEKETQTTEPKQHSETSEIPLLATETDKSSFNNTAVLSMHKENDSTDKILDRSDFVVQYNQVDTLDCLPNTAVNVPMEVEPGPVISESTSLKPGSDEIESMDEEIVTTRDVSFGLSAEHRNKVSASEPPESDTKSDALTAIVDRISASLSRWETKKVFPTESDNELSTDSIPDIVDEDPDSD